MAGVALSQVSNVGPNLGQTYIADSFMVVVGLGGVGNLWGTLTGGLALGIANKFLEPASGAMLSKIIILVCLILFIQKRPRDCFRKRAVRWRHKWPPTSLNAKRLLNAPTRNFLAVTATLCTLVVVGSLLPAGTALHVPGYLVTLLGKYLTYALLALSVDLVWGFMGVLSLGHGAFFALGGYGFGMYLMRQIGARGVYGNANLPDFMVFLNWKELPWFWQGSEYFAVALLLVVLAFWPAGLCFRQAGLWLACFRRVFFSIMSQAMTYALMLAFFRNEMGFGGNNGLTDFKTLVGFELQNRRHAHNPFACSPLPSWRATACAGLMIW